MGTSKTWWVEQMMEAVAANYRVCWSQDRKYYAQFGGGGWWTDLNADSHASHAEAVLDCKLGAGAAREECRMHPLIADGTPGRPEYENDPCGPYPWSR